MPKYRVEIERTESAEVIIEAQDPYQAADVAEFMLEHVEDLETVDGWKPAWVPSVVDIWEEVEQIHAESVEERYSSLGPQFTSQEEEDAFWAGYELAVSEFDQMTRSLEIAQSLDEIEQEEAE